MSMASGGVGAQSLATSLLPLPLSSHTPGPSAGLGGRVKREVGVGRTCLVCAGCERETEHERERGGTRKVKSGAAASALAPFKRETRRVGSRARASPTLRPLVHPLPSSWTGACGMASLSAGESRACERPPCSNEETERRGMTLASTDPHARSTLQRPSLRRAAPVAPCAALPRGYPR